MSTVTRNGLVGAYHVLWFRDAAIAAEIRPGQFVNVRTEATLLRRPFSVYLVEGDEVAIAFDVLGEGTRWIASRRPGDDLDVIGPLGRGFPIPDEQGVDLLVGGGYGTAALTSVAQALEANGSAVHAIVGARTADRVFVDDVLRERCASLAIVTDDGSQGARGIVTDPMPDLIARFSPRAVYACGPNRMLEAVAATAARAGVPCFVAAEEFMACGVGVCWTCVLPVVVDGETKHLRVCTDGPVFDGTRLPAVAGASARAEAPAGSVAG